MAVVRHIKSQFMAEGLLLAAVSEPVVHSYLCHQVRAQASQLGRRHTPLKTLSPEGEPERAQSKRNIFKGGHSKMTGAVPPLHWNWEHFLF